MEIEEIWKISEEMAIELLNEIPPIEKLYKPIKDEKQLTYIKQDEKSMIEYNKILDNYINNSRRAIESILIDDYKSTMEKGQEIPPYKLKKIIGSVKESIRKKVEKRFEELQKKAENAVKFNAFIKEKEEEINDVLIDTNTAKKVLCLTNRQMLTRVKNLVRCFKFTYGTGVARYYFSKSDIDNLANAEKDLIPIRKIDEEIRKLRKTINRLEWELNFFDGDPYYNKDKAQRELEYRENFMKDLKEQKRQLQKKNNN